MPAKYSAEAYLYTAARVRSFEAALLTGERIRTLAALDTVAEVLAALGSYGYDVEEKEGDGMLQAVLKKGLAAVSETMPDRALSCLITYPYDCHNIKACLKAPRRGIDPAELLIDTGSVPAADLLAAMKSGDYGKLPPHMAAAIPEATETFSKTADPREIDFILDKAAFADMKEGLAGFAFGEALLTLRVDCVNLILLRRLTAVADPDLRAALFERAKLAGGSVQEDLFAAVLKGEKTLAAITAGGVYAPLFAGDPTPALLERRADDLQMAKVREARYVTFGPQIPFAYLWALDAEVKNLRIILAGKRAGLGAEAILERVRESYV